MLGMIVVTFVISFGVGTFSNQKEVLVEVGTDEIMVSQFQRQYNRRMELLQQQYGENADLLAARMNLKDVVMKEMVNRKLLLQSADSAGMVVTAEEVKNVVISQEAFKVNNKFDYNTYQTILSQNRLTAATYEGNLMEDLLVGRQQRNLIAGLIISPAEVEQRYRIENEKLELEVMEVVAENFKTDKKPDAAAMKAYYEKNPAQFTQPKQVKIRYFLVSLKDMEASAKVSERAVTRYYERNKETLYTTPKEVKASHILKKVAQDAPKEAVEKAKKTLEDVAKQIKAGKDFAAMAKAHSDDLTKARGGDLGYFKHEDMVGAFSEAAFSLKKGEVSHIVRSQFGFHLIKTTGIKPEVVKPFAGVKTEIEQMLKSKRAENKLGLEIKRIPGQLKAEGIEKIAKEMGKKISDTPLFDAKTVLPGLGSALPLYGQLRQKKAKDTGVWKRNPVQGHLFYEIVEIKDSFVKPMDQVKKEVAGATEIQQRKEFALAQAKEAFKNMKTRKDFSEFARKNSLTVKTVNFTAVDSNIEGIGFNKELQNAAFRLTSKKPVGLSIRANQAYLIHLKRRFMPESDKAAEQKKAIESKMQNTLRQMMLELELNRLREEVEVKVIAPEYLNTAQSG